jgi:Zn-dependent peptidase ImmA (M78 family)
MNNPSQLSTPSALRSLRDLMPRRALSFTEALHVAEAQANRLLDRHGVSQYPVPTELVTEQPRVRIERSLDLPTSGSAHWDGTAWVVTLNASEYDLRQRFSLLHEYKHIVDHPTRDLIRDEGYVSAATIAERLADYFAACVLMPRAWVKAAFFAQTQSVEQLAQLFQVSPRAMAVRLSQLGLLEPARRISTDVTATRRRKASYYRQRSIYFTPVGAAA